MLRHSRELFHRIHLCISYKDHIDRCYILFQHILQLRRQAVASDKGAQLQCRQCIPRADIATSRHHNLLAARHYACQSGHAKPADDIYGHRYTGQPRKPDRYAYRTLKAALRTPAERLAQGI